MMRPMDRRGKVKNRTGQSPIIVVSRAMAEQAAGYNVYGFEFRVSGGCSFAREGLAEDFAYFAAGQTGPDAIELELDEGEPDYRGLPECDARFYTPRNTVYCVNGTRYLDFGGRGLGTFEGAARRFAMRSADPHLVYEAAYLFLLSQIGQYGDARGLHRLHALAMERQGRAVLALLPMGGGKSTLGAALLKRPEMRILSDDSPFIGRQGQALAFPLRLGLLEGREEEAPAEHRRLVRRMEFGPKYLVNYSYFAGKVAKEAAPGLVLLGRRTLAREGRLEPASYTETLKAMVPNLIVGIGLFQGLEYLLEHSAGELARKGGLGWSRLRNAHALIRRSKNYVFHMGRDVEANAQLVAELAEREFGPGR